MTLVCLNLRILNRLSNSFRLCRIFADIHMVSQSPLPFCHAGLPPRAIRDAQLCFLSSETRRMFVLDKRCFSPQQFDQLSCSPPTEPIAPRQASSAGSSSVFRLDDSHLLFDKPQLRFKPPLLPWALRSHASTTLLQRRDDRPN